MSTGRLTAWLEQSESAQNEAIARLEKRLHVVLRASRHGDRAAAATIARVAAVEVARALAACGRDYFRPSGLMYELEVASRGFEARVASVRAWSAAARAFVLAGDRLLQAWPAEPLISREEQSQVATVIGWFRQPEPKSEAKSLTRRKRGPNPDGYVMRRECVVVDVLHRVGVHLSVQKQRPSMTALGEALLWVREVDGGPFIANVFTPTVVEAVKRAVGTGVEPPRRLALARKRLARYNAMVAEADADAMKAPGRSTRRTRPPK